MSSPSSPSDGSSTNVATVVGKYLTGQQVLLVRVMLNCLCCAGPPLPEALKLLAPLANIEELSLGGNKLGGTITADVAVFTKLKKLELCSMALDGKIGSTRSERFTFRVDVFPFLQDNCPRNSEIL